MIAKIQIKVGIRKYSNLKVVFWLFFHNSITTKGHHRYDGIRTCTSPRDAEGITGSCYFMQSIGFSVVANSQDKILTFFGSSE